MSREHAGASVVGRALCAMGLACALAGILLEGVSVEIPGIALGAVGYGFATRSGDRAGQVLGGGQCGAMRGLDGDPLDRLAWVVPGVLRKATKGEHGE